MRSNITINSEKFNLIPTYTRKRSLSCRHQITRSVHHSSHPKCFQIMNYCDFFSCDFFSCNFFSCDFFSVYRIVNSWIWLLLILHKRTVPILPSFINRYFSQITPTNMIYLFNSAEYLTASKTVACKQVQNFRPPWLFDFQNFYQSTKTGKIFSKKCISGTNSKIE